MLPTIYTGLLGVFIPHFTEVIDFHMSSAVRFDRKGFSTESTLVGVKVKLFYIFRGIS